MKITVLGCGRWGSFITWYLDSIGNQVTLYGRKESKHMQQFLYERKNDVLQFDIVNIKDVDYIVNPVDSAYILYKIIIILMFKYRLDIKGNDIVKYSNMKSFLDELIYSKEKSISSKEC
ncbi:MAG: hypothetical protein ACI4P7_04020 [Bacilli bacterium]